MQAGKNRRILVIDDNAAIHEDFRKILMPEGVESSAFDEQAALLFEEPTRASANDAFDLHGVQQGLDGVALVREGKLRGEPFALAFVDVRMPPGIDGIETVRRLWREDERIQTVICTAYSDYSAEEIVGELGISDRLMILKKPFDCSEVLLLSTALTEKWYGESMSAELTDVLAEGLYGQA